MAIAAESGRTAIPKIFVWAAALLGFALGGFADGIVFHQILQWHHLLSNVPGDAFDDLRVQVLADGVFHVAMYAVMAVGLWLLWRSRVAFLDDRSDRLFAAAMLVGFGLWHIVDAVFSHWLLGIHHIRMATDNVLLWDMSVFAFGLLVTAAGLWLARHRPQSARAAWRRPRALPGVLVGLVVGAGMVAAQTPPGAATTVLFRPGTDADAALAAVAAVEARLIWSDPSQPTLWVIEVDAARTPHLYASGAILISRSILPAGCFGALARRPM
jgi:uncharacterized membrane protein